MAANEDGDVEAFGLLLAFDTDDPAFARGFEAGRIWALLRSNPDEPLTATVAAANAEMTLRMAEATGRTVRGEELGDGWVEVAFSEAHRTRIPEPM